MLRLFIALLLPDDVKKSLGDLIADLKPRAEGIRWVAPQNLHLTLKFIGDAPESAVEPIGHIIEGIVAGKPAITVTMAGCGGFPNLRGPRVIWVGLTGSEPAGEIATALNRQLVPLKIAAEKKAFSPHLTLGRVKERLRGPGLAEYLEQLRFSTGPIILDRIALVKSTLTPGGPIYENLKQYKLE